MDPNISNAILKIFYNMITDKVGWAFSWFGLISLLFLIWLALSRYGKIRLGKPGEKPEYSRFEWIAMLFCTGQGSTLITWSILEPIQYYAGPPFGLKIGTVEAVEYAATYGAFHWGIIPWAMMTLPAVPLAYYYLVRRRPQLSMATPFEGRINGTTRSLIDVLVLFACIANSCTSLGMATPTIAALIASMFNIESTFALKAAVMVAFISIFGTSCILGLDKGIKKLSKINIYLVYGLLIFILLIGPTTFILNSFTNGMGIMFNEFFRMSLYTDPIGKSAWPQGWTIFYWAWWLCACPYTAIFIAKISRGRTIREVAIGGFLWGTLGDMVAFAILGGSTIRALHFEGLGLVSIMQQHGNPAAVAAMIANLPLSVVIVPLFIASMFVFSSTTYDSCTYVMANVTWDSRGIKDEAPRWLRVVWVAVVGLSVIGMMAIGGLAPLQSASIVTAIPLAIICIIICFLFMKDIKRDYLIVYGDKVEEEILEYDVEDEFTSASVLNAANK